MSPAGRRPLRVSAGPTREQRPRYGYRVDVLVRTHPMAVMPLAVLGIRQWHMLVWLEGFKLAPGARIRCTWVLRTEPPTDPDETRAYWAISGDVVPR